ncbi:MAG: TIR domain-containing protein, partial [Bacteroidaceae bacterium]|nr:TIR domain-containing protein [Bacteroidaceae bacterium]
MNNQQKDIFISYCRRDIEKVKRIKQEIEAETQAQCWMDLEGIESGNPKFTKMIIRAINSCPIFLFMLSEASQQSENALKELDFAYKKHREEGKKVAIVYIEPYKMNDEFSFDYGKADTIDWQNPLQREKLIRNLKAWTNYEAKLAETHQEKERLALAEAEAQQRAEEARKRREEEVQRKAEAEQRRKAELEKEKQKEQTAALFAKCISPFRKMKKSAIGWIVGIGAMIFLIFWGISQCSTPQIGIGTLEGHTSYVYSASFSPDGSRIVSASQDSTVRIWNAATGECIRT